MRGSVGFDISLLSVAILLPAAIVAVFPYDVVGFSPRAEPAPSVAAAAFVTLTEAEEFDMLKLARTAWQGDAAGISKMRAELLSGNLPEEAGALGETLVSRPYLPIRPVEFGLVPYRPTQAAPAPAKIPAEPPVRRTPAFSREELLKISEFPFEHKEN